MDTVPTLTSIPEIVQKSILMMWYKNLNKLGSFTKDWARYQLLFTTIVSAIYWNSNRFTTDWVEVEVDIKEPLKFGGEILLNGMRLGDFPNCEDVLKRLVYRILFSEEALVFAKANILAGEEMALAEKEKSSRMAEALAKLWI